MLRRLLVLMLVAALTPSAVAAAAEPPNQNDPCSRNGRNTCGTNGEGAYRNYRYGVRWFGDYRGAVPKLTGATFCIDLRFWYPSKAHDYEKRSAAGLKNKDGEVVSAANLRRMSYAVWRYGRTNDPARQAAVMLQVHRLMNDGAPGEVDPQAISAAGRTLYAQIGRDLDRYAGPYKIQATVPEGLIAGKATELTVQVLSASGRRVPGVEVSLTSAGAAGLPAKLSTGSTGVAKVAFTPDDPRNGVKLDLRAADLPADLPALYVPTRGESARNGQRLIAPAARAETGRVAAAVRAAPAIETEISATAVTPGTAITDKVKVTGLAGLTVTVKADLYGPYPARDQIKCTDAPIWSGTFEAAGDGIYTTEPVTLAQPGYYTYRESIAASPSVVAVETACALGPETTVVRGAPAIATQISAQETAPGAKITDTAVVSGLGKLAAAIKVELWGPFATRAAIACTGTPFWTGTLAAPGDGSYVTPEVTLTRAGYYTYRESIAATEAFDAVTTPCGEATETTLAKGAPAVTTVVSSAVTKPGSQIFDRIKITGLGQTPATVEVALYGPYASRAEIDCEGAPYWKGSLNVTGDGTVSSPKTTLKRAGFYTYRERIVGSETVAAAETDCAVEAETSLSAPQILTGRGERRVAYVAAAPDRDVPQPTRVRLARLGVEAKIAGVGIDTRAGALAIPKNIGRVGWWSDGAAPGDRAGAILLAGHVDSAKAGAGAFYALKGGARRGDVIELSSDDGKTRRFRVTAAVRVRKADLPASIFSRTGAHRLVLVTCGGPFDAAKGHYRDNVIVTAVPV